MNESIGILLVLVGQAIGLFVRLKPGLSNTLIPKITWIANFVAILSVYADKLVQAIGPVALFADPSGVGFMAGIATAGILKVGLAALVASVLQAVLKWVYDNGTKPALPANMLAAGKRMAKSK